MSPGKLVFELYYRPLGAIRHTLKTGIRRTAEIRRGKRMMVKASKQLSEIIYPNAPHFDVYFLTGKRYWFQTAFCLYSLQRYAGVNIRAYILDDGSFDESLEAEVKLQFPTTVTVIRKSRIEELLDQTLPSEKFPVLRRRRIEYPHIRKLTDVHVLSSISPKLVLDSDMLFFREPVAILDWLAQPKGMLFLRDTEESYGYSKEIMRELTAYQELPEKVNVGVAGISSNSINWKELEQWTRIMLQKEGSSYLQEQALTAMLATKEECRFLPEAEYKVLPSILGEGVPEILHHYVAEAKYDYFVKGWKLLLKGDAPSETKKNP